MVPLCVKVHSSSCVPGVPLFLQLSGPRVQARDLTLSRVFIASSCLFDLLPSTALFLKNSLCCFVLFLFAIFFLFSPLLSASLPLFSLLGCAALRSPFTPRPPPLPPTHKITRRAKPLTQPPVPLLHPHRSPHSTTIYLLPAAIHAEEDSCLNVYATSYFLFLRAPIAFQRKLCSPRDGAAS